MQGGTNTVVPLPSETVINPTTVEGFHPWWIHRVGNQKFVRLCRTRQLQEALEAREKLVRLLMRKGKRNQAERIVRQALYLLEHWNTEMSPEKLNQITQYWDEIPSGKEGKGLPTRPLWYHSLMEDFTRKEKELFQHSTSQSGTGKDVPTHRGLTEVQLAEVKAHGGLVSWKEAEAGKYLAYHLLDTVAVTRKEGRKQRGVVTTGTFTGQTRGYAEFLYAVECAKPRVDFRSVRLGGSVQRYPVEMTPSRQLSFALRWVVAHARKRNEKGMAVRLAKELRELIGGVATNATIRKRDQWHKTADANRAFM